MHLMLKHRASDVNRIRTFLHSGNSEVLPMEVAKIGKKGQLTIPRPVLRAAGMTEGSWVVLEATANGAIELRPVAVYAVEVYSEERVQELEEANTLPAAMERRIQAYLRKRQTR
jgi:AbrB family looped-hinge helix DNA binding protein